VPPTTSTALRSDWAALANLARVTNRFIAGGPRRIRQENESFWAFLLGWIGSLFRVDRRL